MAAGGELIIDNKLLKLLDNVDKKLEKIAKTSGSAQANIFKMFDKTGSQGVDGLIRKLQQLEKYYSTIGQNDSRGMKRIANDARKTADEINKLIAAVQQRWTPNFKGAMDYSQNAKNLSQDREAINRLRQARETLSRADSEYFKKLSQINGAIAVHSSRLRMATGASREMSKAHRGLMDISGQLTRKLALVFSVSQIEGYMNKLVNVRREFELQKRSLEVLLRDHHEANKLWNQTVQLAVKSPFRVKQLVTYTKQLAAYRIETDKLYDTTKMLADVSAGLGVDMNRLILAYGQVRAAEFLRGTELRQFTEAGIPMLEELASHFTKLEGRAVSTADVFDRISKRMVKFKDVAEVFKRITSEGGTFYKMQEKQAETLDGQISNLHDAIDLMLNDIGAAQDGLMKNMIAATRNIVENWRAIASVMEVVGVSLSLKIVSLFARGFMAATAHATLATKSLHGVALAGAKVNVMFQTLTKKIVAHPWITLGAAILVAGKAVWDYSRAIDANNKKYDELSNAEIARIDRLKQIQSEVEKNNKVIKENTNNTKEQSDAQKKNNVLLEELKTKFPEIYQDLVKQKDGTLEVSKAIERQNQLLYINIALQQQAKGGVFQQDYQKNYAQAVEAYSKMQTQLVDIQTAATQASANLTLALGKGEIPSHRAKEIEEILGQIRKTTTIEEAFKFYRLLGRMEARAFQSAFGDTVTSVIHGVNTAFREANDEVVSYRMALADFLQNVDNQISSYQLGVSKFMESGDTEGAKQWIDTQLEALGTVDKAIKQEAREHIVQKIGVQLVWENQPDKVWTEDDFTQEWQKTLWKAIKTVQDTNPSINLGVTVAKIAQTTTEADKEKLFKGLEEPVKHEIENNKKLLSALNEEQARYTEEQIAQAKASTEPLEHLKKVMALFIKQGGSHKDWFSEMGKAIRDTHKDFITLHKDLNKTEALQLALEKHKDVFAEAAKNAGLKGLDLESFTNYEIVGDAIEGLEVLLDLIPEKNKKARLSIQKMIGELTGEDNVRKAEEAMKRISNAIDQAFSTYEISIELDKMGVSSDLANQLFGIESIDLSGLRQQIVDKFNLKDEFGKQLSAGFNTETIVKYAEKMNLAKEQIDKLRESLQKVDEKEDKALLERQQKYLNFLVEQQSKRVQILVKEMRDLEDVQKTFTLTDKKGEQFGLTKDQTAMLNQLFTTNEDLLETQIQQLGLDKEKTAQLIEQYQLLKAQKDLAISGVQHTTQEALDKQTWEDFKASGYYDTMFDDLNTVSNKALDALQKRLNDMLTQLQHLPPSAYKEVKSAIAKIESVKMERNPFSEALKAQQELNTLNKDGVKIKIDVDGTESIIKGRKKIEDELATQLEKQELLQREIDLGTSLLSLDEEGKKNAIANIKDEETKSLYQKLNLQQITDIVNKKKEEKKITDDNVQNLQDGANKYEGISAKQKKMLQATSEWADTLGNAFASVDQLLEALGVGEDSVARAMLQAGQAMTDMISQMANLAAASNTALGVIGIIATAVQTVAKIFSIFSALHDAKLEKQIEKQAAAVETLEKAYERLQKQMEAAYSIADIQHITAERQKNSEEQIASYERMIELEKQKKDSDAEKIKEWREAIEEEKEAMLEAEREREKAVGGFGNQEDYKEASEAFVDAWMSAFRETGNGLSGLEEKMDEYFLNMVKKQLLGRGVEQLMANFYNEWDNMVGEDGYFDSTEMDKARSLMDEYGIRLNNYLTSATAALGVSDELMGKSQLGTLQKGIQGITEDQADVLSAYINSIRFMVGESNGYLKIIASNYSNGDTPNPMLGQLQLIANQATAINDLLSSVTKAGHKEGGYGIKVFTD